MKRVCTIQTVVAGGMIALLIGFVGSSAQESSPEAVEPAAPIAATAEALGVPVDCVVEAFGNLGAGSPAASPVSSTPTALLPVEAEVALGDLFYAPCAVTFPANVPSTLTLTNENGAATGNVVIDSLNVRSAYVAPGETTDVAIDAPAGVYVFYSDAPNQRAAGRAGILIVQGDATPTP